MQELLQIIVKRIGAIEDAYHEGLRTLSRLEQRLTALESRERFVVQAPPDEELPARIEAVEQRMAASERTAAEVPSLVSRLFVLEERLGAEQQRLDEGLASQQQRLEEQAGVAERLEEVTRVVDAMHGAHRELAESIAIRLEQRLETLEERFGGLEGAIGDSRSMADHVIAHEAQLTALEHQLGDLAAGIGEIEEQTSSQDARFETFDRQLAAHRADMSTIEERAVAIERRVDMGSERAAAIEQRQDALEQAAITVPAARLSERLDAIEERVAGAAEPVADVRTRLAELEARASSMPDAEEIVGRALAETAGRFDTVDARFASMSDRVAALAALHNDVVRNGEQVAMLGERLGEVTGERLEAILERLASLDRLAADVASHAGQLAALRDRPGVTAGSGTADAGGSEIQARVDDLTREVVELRESATMLESIRTLLAASDVEKSFDEMNERISKLDAQIATLFTLQRMSAESEAKPTVFSLETLERLEND